MSIASLLDRPEYVHVATNHLPLVGLLIAMLSLIGALALRNRNATFAALALIALLALSAWVVSYFGEEGYDRVLSTVDEEGQAFLQYHQHLADRWMFLFYLCAGSALLGIGLAWKWPRTLTSFAIVTLLFGCASVVAGIFIAHSGGEIRHREFRSAPPPDVSDRP